MLEVFKIFIIATIAITLWTAFLLLQDKRGIPKLNRWFAVFLFALTTPQMDLYAAHAIPGGVLPLAITAATFIWLKGPFIWIFVAVLTRSEVSPRKVWVHFVPWLLALITLFLFTYTIMSVVMLGMCHALVYLCAALWRLVNKRHYVAEVWQGFQNSAYYWLLYIVGGLILLISIDLVVMSLVMSGILQTYNLLDYGAFPIFSVYALSIGILSVYRPQLLFRETTASHQEKVVTSDDIETNLNLATSDAITQTLADQKTRYLELDVTAAQLLTQELTKLMQDKQLYRQNELSLPDLAQSLGISVHQLSELLNVHLGQSFYEFVNGYRLQFACNMLKNSKCQLRILDIAFEAGFNNKNSFYRAFREGLGITPNQYRERLDKHELKPI